MGDPTMKKITSIVLAGAVMLSLSACSGSSKNDETTVTTTATTTTEATTTTTTEETTTESSEEDYYDDTEESLNFDDLIPSDGEIFIDFSDKYSVEVTDNVLKVLRLKDNTPVESFVNRFDVKPDYSYEDGIWSFYWEDKPEINTFDTIEIKADNVDGKIVLTEDSYMNLVFSLDNLKKGRLIHDQLKDEIGPFEDPEDYLTVGLAINPRNTLRNNSYLENFDGYEFLYVQFTFKCYVNAQSGNTYEATH